MQWSKLRSHLLDFVAPSVRKRIDFHLTHWRKLGDSTHEFWVTIDGKRVFDASYSNRNIEEFVLTRTTGLIGYGDGPGPKKVDDILIGREIHAPSDITSSIRTYFDLDPLLALTSSDPILKALAMIDRRIGRRTLKSIKLRENEHSLVKIFYALRMESLD